MTALERLEAMGYRFELDERGGIRATLSGGLPPPPQAKELLQYCKEHREEVKDALIFRSGKVKSLVQVDVWKLEAQDKRLALWGSIFERKMAELVRVRVHTRSERIEILYVPLVEGWVIDAELNARMFSA